VLTKKVSHVVPSYNKTGLIPSPSPKLVVSSICEGINDAVTVPRTEPHPLCVALLGGRDLSDLEFLLDNFSQLWLSLLIKIGDEDFCLQFFAKI